MTGNPYDRAHALRLLAARLDRNDTAYSLTLANFIECPCCAIRVIDELVDLIAHHIEHGDHRAEWESWLTRKLADLLDALTEAEEEPMIICTVDGCDCNDADRRIP